jgi:GNAT superfamily N-acetyltransferase
MHGDVFDELWLPMTDAYPEFQFALLGGDTVLAEGHTVPLAWDGDDAHLPDGIDAALTAGVQGRAPADTLCALAAEIPPAARGRGLAAELLRAMAELARRHGLARLIAPVRPSWKERYPLTPIERYVTWRRADGQLLDPWMRLHERLGARVATPLPRSMRITGTVAEWEAWTGLAFPEGGTYVFPRGLAPLEVTGGVGRYFEPNVWLIHPGPTA